MIRFGQVGKVWSGLIRRVRFDQVNNVTNVINVTNDRPAHTSSGDADNDSGDQAPHDADSPTDRIKKTRFSLRPPHAVIGKDDEERLSAMLTADEAPNALKNNRAGWERKQRSPAKLIEIVRFAAPNARASGG